MVNSAFVLVIGAVLVQSSPQTFLGRDDAPGKIDKMPKCGVRKNKFNHLIVAGHSASAENFPWHVTIYHGKSPDPPVSVCGGSLIHPKYVLTVRHCTLKDDVGPQLSNDAIFVRMGVDQLYGEKKEVQLLPIVDILAAREIFSVGGKDIALVKLKEPVKFNQWVKLICLPKRDVTPKETGEVVGFGYTENFKTSRHLRAISMQVVENLRCLEAVPDQRFIMDEGLFCGGHATICNGDSGGGLVFLRNGTWEVGGLVAFTLTDDSIFNRCRQDTFVTFISVNKYLPWIHSVLDSKDPIKRFGVPLKKVSRIVGRHRAKAEDYPWHVTIYHVKSPDPPVYVCGGSLIHPKYVLTVRLCTLEDGVGPQLSNDAIFVRMGVEQLYVEKQGMLQRAIESIDIYTDTTRPRGSDIELIELTEPLEFTEDVKTISISTRDVNRKEIGEVVGFGDTENFKTSRHLRAISMQVVENFRCLGVVHDQRFRMDEGLFCGGRATICNGDSGGGLVFLRNGTWELGGLVSFTLTDDCIFNRCRRDTFVTFTSVNKYLPWIHSVLNSKGHLLE